ncbi:hypothetical protein V2H45_14050 [Tumidithrix elongata RA019]|uniref:Uncharacterized protein n=1 Tax=Tumidithrix elongata BACA0141 TaxID=2716417 RepID=A0AAW9PTE8_9CYAN|nr:hypothetical protein [Tumidithrix elongata RA019]
MDTVIAMLQYYSFDLGGYTTDDLARVWSKYESSWVRLAIVESLFQGRYKAVSVNQILSFWERKGEPHCRFNREFERLVCGDFVTQLPAAFSNHPQKVTYTTDKAKTVKAELPRNEPAKLETPKPETSKGVGRSITSPTQNTSTQNLSERIPLPKSSRKQEQPIAAKPSKNSIPVSSPRSVSTAQVPPHVSDVYRSALENMQLFAESSLFVDKLKSMCLDSDVVVSVPQNLQKPLPTTLQADTKITVEVGAKTTSAPPIEATLEPQVESQIEAKIESKVEAIADS